MSDLFTRIFLHVFLVKVFCKDLVKIYCGTSTGVVTVMVYFINLAQIRLVVWSFSDDNDARVL